MQCALPNEDVSEVVELMLSLLACGYDPARKNAVLFFGAAINFRAVLHLFDRSGGLARVLDCLQTVLMLLHGQQDLKAEKQVMHDHHMTHGFISASSVHLLLCRLQDCHSLPSQSSAILHA